MIYKFDIINRQRFSSVPRRGIESVAVLYSAFRAKPQGTTAARLKR